MAPSLDDIDRLTDRYFSKTREAVGRFGDVTVTYAVFMRRPVRFAPRLMVEWLAGVAEARSVTFDIELCFDEGAWVGAGEPLLYITGPLYQLVDLETLYLQRLGAPCVAAYNACARTELCAGCDLRRHVLDVRQQRTATPMDRDPLAARSCSICARPSGSTRRPLCSTGRQRGRDSRLCVRPSATLERAR